MKPVLRYTLSALLWGIAGLYVVWSAVATRRDRTAQCVEQLRIEVTDSSAQGYMVTGALVRKWLADNRIETVGAPIDRVDLQGIEELIGRNGFVRNVRAYVTRDRMLHIEIGRRQPLLRLMTDGRNAYVTADGYVFPAPPASSLYVPVVTGSYRPPFPADFTGPAIDYIEQCRAETERRIREIELEKDVFYIQTRAMRDTLDSVRRRTVTRRWWRLESRERFDKRVEARMAEKKRYRRYRAYHTRRIENELARISRRQEDERRRQKNLEKSYEDFMKLLTFVEFVEDDDFWRSEVVQIIARTTVSGALEVELVPRSGRHRILFGRLEDVERKFDKLLCFYRRGLREIGWDEYSTINVKYSDQVVCKK